MTAQFEREVLGALLEGVHVLAADGTTIYENPAAVRLFGFAPGEMIGQRPHALVHHHRRDGSPYPLEECPIARTLRDGEARRITDEVFFRRDGSAFAVVYRCVPIRDEAGRIAGAVVSFEDAGAELRQRDPARDELAVLARNAPLLRIAGRIARLGGWTIDLPERKLTWSDEVCAIHDLAPGQMQSPEEALDAVLGDMRPVIHERLEACIRDGVPYDLELEKRTAKGRRVWVRTIGEPVRDAAGRIVRVQGAIQDITERKRTDLLLREQAALLDRARDAILVRDLQNRIHYWNEGARRLYGHEAPAVLGRPVTEFMYEPGVALEAFRAADAAVRADGEWSGELEQRTRDGATLLVEGRWTLLRDEEGNATSVLAINADITERRALERQVLRTQRMESIGTLAGGIAHDLNNVLTPILMSIDLLNDGQLTAQQRAILAAVEASANKGADMIRQILAFARGVEGRRVRVDARRLIEELLRIANDTFLKAIEIESRIAPNLPAIVGDPTQLHQVLLNLCVNARDAMPTGGRLTVSADLEDLHRAPPGAAGELPPGRYLVIGVADTGLGMPAEVVDRIFEPFFTTKEHGRGSGLGLSASLAIATRHGGTIDVRSALGRGSVFRVFLPAADAPADAATGDAERAEVRGRGERILLVDDNPMVLLMSRRMLETFGYRVSGAANGREALEEFERERGAFAAVITDMMMPVMDGAALIRALRAIDPGLPILAVSGAGFEAGEHRAGAAAPTVKRLQKPYSTEQLLTALGELLAARNSS
ncbi:MAG: PAS domain S-box protein [Gammaproteobacteria bacterium]|nr:PAS domain S-box protein [Gammaproteobacteria bacterium]